ncbi:EF-hand calcium-binding domain-containing protein 11-like [Lineus longissimus]|uniref:EF-hand calcium-binding domain-containing protein 11-like n=1 Tax=Lineus longissimus TaxID=88925 RepID=UPI002B4C7F3F
MSVTSGLFFRRSGDSHLIRPINGNELKDIKVVFLECDEDKKGFLSREDLKVAMVSLFGYKPSKYEVEKIFENVHSRRQEEENQPEGLKLQEFIEVMSKKIAVKDQDEEIRQMFMAYDTQCHGFLTVEDLKKVASLVAPHMQLQTLETAFREADRDGDGRVSVKDFEFMMRYNEDANS